MKKIIVSLLVTLSMEAFAGDLLLDKKGVDLLKADKVYTIVNLHPDENNRRLYSVNYQLPGLIPLCTEVKIVKLKKKALVFSVPSRDDREYTYLWHKKSTQEGLAKHLSGFFASTCVAEKAKKMSTKDQEGIKAGKPIIGMTRAGILLAMGPPPSHVNYDIDNANEWMYWRNKFARRAVTFNDNGIVTGLR